MTEAQAELKTRIRDTKRRLRAQIPDLKGTFAELEDEIRREVGRIADLRERGEPTIPIIDFESIRDGSVSEEARRRIRHHGAAIVRGTFSHAQAEAWNEDLADYVTGNGYYEQKVDPALDRYFSQLEAGRPQIFGIYWSRPQIEARQSLALAEARAFLNRLWRHEDGGTRHFDPDRECSYADRIRRREPGDATLGLSPHMDAGSVERWIDPGYQRVYRHVFSGNWRDFDPFDGASRTETEEIPSPAVCSMFRTYQGWTALTAQGPRDGTLQLVPLANAIAYLLLRALQEDVPEDVLCGAEPGRALSANEAWHATLLPALSAIPAVEPGDTVWWHPDVIHAVADRHEGKGYSNVMYIGAAPFCAKNAAYLERQKPAFLAGRSPPDFAAEDYEIAYRGRAGVAELSDLGRRQMGFAAW